MSLLRRAITNLAPQTKQQQAVAATIPTWQQGQAQMPDASYETFAREGYSRNEIVYACIEELATSAAEPHIAAYWQDSKGRSRVPTHPVIDLLNRPNPYLSRFDLWATVIMHLGIAGNSYIEKVRSGAGRVVELWLMRPDRVRVVPDPQKFISHYTYQMGPQVFRIEAQDIIHIRNRHPLNDFYGMPPLMAASGRTDIDNYMRDFTKSFFQNAGVPAGLLNVKEAMSAETKGEVRGRFRQEFGGSRGWHNLLVLDNTEATYTPMGMALGSRGIALPELDEIDESRIAMVFGVPLILIGSRLGMQRSTFANYREARASFWDETLIPLYRMLAAALNRSLVPEFAGVSEVEFDLGDVQALREDEDKTHERARRNVQAGVWTLEEGRVATGMELEPDGGTYLLPVNIIPTPAKGIAEAEVEITPEGKMSANGTQPLKV